MSSDNRSHPRSHHLSNQKLVFITLLLTSGGTGRSRSFASLSLLYVRHNETVRTDSTIVEDGPKIVFSDSDSRDKVRSQAAAQHQKEEWRIHRRFPFVRRGRTV